MGVFRFKQFSVRNERSALKVNTDGVLLGAAVPVIDADRLILDIGTGTGVIALMLAQRRLAHRDSDSEQAPVMENARIDGEGGVKIIGIDIDPITAEEAEINFNGSPWASSLEAVGVGLENFGQQMQFDLIVSNPPYYDSSLTNPDSRKAIARHTDDNSLSFREVLDFASKSLSENGRVAMILPADQEAPLLRHGRMCGLYPCNILRVRTVERKSPSRVIVTFSRSRDGVEEQVLTLMKDGKYTDEYISLVKDFYLFA